MKTSELVVIIVSIVIIIIAITSTILAIHYNNDYNKCPKKTDLGNCLDETYNGYYKDYQKAVLIAIISWILSLSIPFVWIFVKD